jgi:hypothetical protein
LFAAALNQGGFALQVPAGEMYYELLRSHYVAIHGKRGVKIRGLWYDGPALHDDDRDGPSERGGRHKGKWVVHSDPRDRRHVFFQDPRTRDWHALRWTGLPPEGEMPAFGDTRVTELLREAAACGVKPQSDAELRPLLLKLIGGSIPVDAWPTQMGRRKRAEHAREVLQARAASADRPAPAAAPGGGDEVIPLRPAAGDTATGEPAWRQRAGDVASAVDDERGRRRQDAVPARPPPPPALGARRRSVFALPAGEDDTEDG